MDDDNLEHLELDKPLSIGEMNLLLKLKASQEKQVVPFLQTKVRNVNDRLRYFKVAMDKVFNGTLPVVAAWWAHSWENAGRSYKEWLRTDILNREQVTCVMGLPLRFKWIEDHFHDAVFGTMPPVVQNAANNDQQAGHDWRVHELLFALMKYAGPGTATEKQDVMSRLRNPRACTDPAAAKENEVRCTHK